MDVFFPDAHRLILIAPRHRFLAGIAPLLLEELLLMHACDLIQKTEGRFIILGNYCNFNSNLSLDLLHIWLMLQRYQFRGSVATFAHTKPETQQQIQQSALMLQTVFSCILFTSSHSEDKFRSKRQRHRATMGPGVNTHLWTMTAQSRL